jgi:KDO2-lipid IV(A) lauroyltransferase
MRKRLEYALAASLVGLLRAAPLSLSYRLGYAAGELLNLLLPKLRQVALHNLAMAFPDLPAADHSRIANGVFRSVGRVLVALARFPSIDKTNVGDWISYQGLEHYPRTHDRGDERHGAPARQSAG